MSGCVFCGAPANSREHVIPQWISRSVLEANPGIDQNTVVLAGDGQAVRDFTHRFGESAVKIVCATCNNGWMNGLEEAVRAFLIPLILSDGGTVVVLDRQQQADLAAWVMKTLMMFSYQLPKEDHQAIPPADYTHLYRNRRLSTRRMTARTFHLPVTAWGTAHQVLFEANVGKLTHPRGFVGFLRLGHFGVQICSVQLPADQQLCEFAEFSNVKPLWPPADRFVWPPPQPCDETHLATLTGQSDASPIAIGTRKRR
ncbi:hypothetical protein [Streptomyces pristinaespiralis]|uniref:hypothetical protein n=1 Tax=Streptomyces pristinaespiralis TaxID=38300 RepID=UPI0038338930